MDIRSIKHRGLKRFIERDDPSRLNSEWVERIRNIVAALVVAPDVDGILAPPGWRLHRYRGGARRGTISINVSGNWRITFKVDDGEIIDLDLEDPH